MAETLRVLLPTDVFPPRAGGAGWSAHALSRALQARGHQVIAIVPRRGLSGLRQTSIAGVPVVEVGYAAPSLPFVQNYYRFERFWPRLRAVIGALAAQPSARAVIIHAQHAQTIPAAVQAGQQLHRPVVATVRDAWPWHYFATGLLADRVPLPAFNAWSTWLDLLGRLGALRGTLAAPFVPYLYGHVRRRAHWLAQADAVIAVSHYIQQRLATLVPAERLWVLPNLIDVAATQRIAAQPLQVAVAPRFVLFVGKLERNKGAHLLPTALLAAREAGAELPPLVIAGSGALEAPLRQELSAHGLEHMILNGWVDHDEVLRLMARAEVVLFPSAWGEPLSRVLLEACAAGSCIAAMDTGGTSDIITDGVNGRLAHQAQALGRVLAELLNDRAQRQRLRAAALRTARERFDADVVAAQVEALYLQLCRAYDTGRASG